MRWRSSSHQRAGGVRQLSSTIVWKAEVTFGKLFQADHEVYSWELITGLSCYVIFPFLGLCWLYLFTFYLLLYTTTGCAQATYYVRPITWWHSLPMQMTGSYFYFCYIYWTANLYLNINHRSYTTLKKIFCLHLWFY